MGSIERPQLRRIPVTAPIEVFIEAITKDGGCICTEFVTPEEVAQANAEVQPFLDSDKPWQVVLTKLNEDFVVDLPRANCSLQRRVDATDSSGEVQLLARSSSCTLCIKPWESTS